MDGILQSLIDAEWVKDTLTHHTFEFLVWSACMFAAGVKSGLRRGRRSSDDTGDRSGINVSAPVSSPIVIGDNNKVNDVGPLTPAEVEEIKAEL